MHIKIVNRRMLLDKQLLDLLPVMTQLAKPHLTLLGELVPTLYAVLLSSLRNSACGHHKSVAMHSFVKNSANVHCLQVCLCLCEGLDSVMYYCTIKDQQLPTLLCKMSQ